MGASSGEQIGPNLPDALNRAHDFYLKGEGTERGNSRRAHDFYLKEMGCMIASGLIISIRRGLDGTRIFF